jgi:hypothetical protein
MRVGTSRMVHKRRKSKAIIALSRGKLILKIIWYKFAFLHETEIHKNSLAQNLTCARMLIRLQLPSQEHSLRFFRVLTLIVSFALPCVVLGQSTNASLTGIVDNSSKAVIVGAQIAAINTETGVKITATSNGEGQYTISSLSPGTYRIEVDKEGYRGIIEAGLVLHVQDIAQINFHMAVGSMSETVTVNASGQQINTIDGSVSTVIDRDFVENMPLNGRSFQDLLTLSPGVAQVANSYGTGYGVGYSGDIVVNGQRTESNYYTVDGVSANTGAMPSSLGGGAGVSGNVPSLTALGTTQGLVSVDALQEFRSTTSTYSAEYAGSPGGLFSFRTRSGTNELHGNVYDFFRNDALDATNWFNDYLDEGKGRERQNDFGGTLGGPIVIPHLYSGKNRSFFFFSYEGLRLDSPQAATQVEVPDNTLRTQSPAALLPLLNAFPVENGGSDGQNDGFGYYITTVSYPSRLNSTSVRLDHSIGDKLSIFGRYASTPSNTTTYSEAISSTTQYNTQTATVGATYAPSSHQSNELRFNFTDESGTLTDQSTNLGGAVPFSLSSIPGPSTTFPENNSNLYVVFEFADFTSLNLESLPTDQKQINLADTHNWTLGRHNVKAGLDWRRLTTVLAAWNPVEEIAFDNDEVQVLQNVPDYSEVQTYGSLKAEPLYTNFSSFIQDDWRIGPRLALSFGLRWDINPAPTNASGPLPYAINELNNLSATQLAPHGAALWNTDWLGFAPRIGFAYQLNPASNRNTVVRSGFGVFYDPGNTQGSGGYEGIGFVASTTYSNASFPLTSAQLTLPTPSTATPYSGGVVVGFDPNLKLPYSLQYNLAIEQALSSHESLTLNYVGSQAHRLLTSFITYPEAIGNPYFAPGTELYSTDGRASSNYNALQVKYQRSLTRGLQALASYTFSHSIDNASTNFGIYSLLHASSDFDIRHNLQIAASYVPPQFNHSEKFASVVNDWGFDFRFARRSALPVDIIGTRTLDAGTGTYLQYQPNLVPGQPLYLYGPEYPGGRAMNYSAVARAASGIQGDLPRNYARGFGAVQLDTAIRREIPIHDQFHLQFRAETFNVMNHPMFGSIYNYLVYGPSRFGRAYNTLNSLGSLNSLYQVGGPRSLQLSLRLVF